MKRINKIVKLSMVFWMILIVNLVYGQEVNMLEQQINPGAVIDELPLPSPSIEGSFYLYEDWCKGSVTLKNGDVIDDVLLKYDLKNNILEIKTPKFVKVCIPNLLKEFSLEDDLQQRTEFTNISAFDRSKIGILEIRYAKGDHMYAVEHYAEIKEATYVPAIDMGSRNKKILKKSNHYLVKNTNLIPFKKSKKSILNITGKHSSTVESYIKSNGLKLKKEEDLLQLMRYYIDMQ